MTIPRAERISGHNVLKGDGDWIVYCPCGSRQRTIRIPIGADESASLLKLVTDVYRHHCAIVRENQRYLCGLCGQLKPLECHHREGRGMASSKRSDRIEDLVALCNHCHQEAETHNLEV